MTRSFGARASRSRGDPEDPVVFPERRNEARLHPLQLEPEHVERVGPGDRVFDPGEDRDAELARRRAACRVAGPQTATSAPSLRRPQMLLRATRLCSTSPQMATLSPSIRPNRSRSVSMSSRPWVGCSCLPSPALITLERMRSPRNCAAPEADAGSPPCRSASPRGSGRCPPGSRPWLTEEPVRGHVHRVGARAASRRTRRRSGSGWRPRRRD